jgi:hypothetical protein
MSAMDRIVRDTIAAHPHPTEDPLGRLRHTVSVCGDHRLDEVAVLATSGIYPASETIDNRDGGSTGLTYGDLRELLARLGG